MEENKMQVHPRQKQRILERDNFKCVNCGATGDFNCLEVDHIISVKDGGCNEENNLQTLCYKCNMDKYYEKNVTNKYLLELSPLERLNILKDKMREYKGLTPNEFKIIMAQDEIFKRLRLNFRDAIPLFCEVNGIKRDSQELANSRYIQQRNQLINVLRGVLDLDYREFEEYLNGKGITIDFSGLAKICKKEEESEEEVEEQTD